MLVKKENKGFFGFKKKLKNNIESSMLSGVEAC